MNVEMSDLRFQTFAGGSTISYQRDLSLQLPSGPMDANRIYFSGCFGILTKKQRRWRHGSEVNETIEIRT